MLISSADLKNMIKYLVALLTMKMLNKIIADDIVVFFGFFFCIIIIFIFFFQSK